MRTGKPLPPNFFFVNSYDLKSMSLKFGNDIFINFEMPRYLYFKMIIWKMSISVLFRPSVIRGPWSIAKTIEYSVTSDNEAWV